VKKMSKKNITIIGKTEDKGTRMQDNCICGVNGLDADCVKHRSLITDRVGFALRKSME
jgi:hypothetical protein